MSANSSDYYVFSLIIYRFYVEYPIKYGIFIVMSSFSEQCKAAAIAGFRDVAIDGTFIFDQCMDVLSGQAYAVTAHGKHTNRPARISNFLSKADATKVAGSCERLQILWPLYDDFAVVEYDKIGEADTDIIWGRSICGAF